ncbi:hypothetical protein Q5O14_17905 [Eubacteriaceae bacterium ES2]|nr:hypothetical protein Q5O14_17905 [Eubacteriaceae bacterium ES2]
MDPTQIKARLEELNEKRTKTLRYMAGRTPGHSSNGTSYVDADHIHGNTGVTAVEMFEAYDKITVEMNELRSELKDYSNRFDNLKDKIIFLVNVYGMTQKEAAEYLGYSYGYIRNVCYKMKRCDNTTNTFDQ